MHRAVLNFPFAYKWISEISLYQILIQKYFRLIFTSNMLKRAQGHHGWGQEGPCPSNFSEIVGFSVALMLHQKIVVLLLLEKKKVLNYIRKSLNLAPPTLQVP